MSQPGAWVRLPAALLLVLLAGCGGRAERPLAVTDASPPYRQVQRREVYELPDAVQTVLIRNAHGDVRVRWSARRAVGVYAVVQEIGVEPLQPQLRTGQAGTRFTLGVRYPGDRRWVAGDHSRGRVDLGVWLPKGMGVDIETVDGTVQVKRARGAVRVRTQSGRIEVSTAAELDVESVSGDIVARQESGEWRGLSRVRSASGRVLAAVPVFADVHLSARAGGILSVDPGLPTADADAHGGMRLQARFGAGTHALELDTGGDLHIVPVIRLPPPLP